MAAHIDPISGDCEETEAYCPLKQIGCSETKIMKLKERKFHAETNAPNHLKLLFQTVLQLFSMIGINTHDLSHVTKNGTRFPSQTELEHFAKQVERILKENGEMKSKIAHQEEKIQLMDSKQQQNFSSSASAENAQDILATDLSRKLNSQEAKLADLEFLLFEGNKVNEDLQRQVSKIEKEQEAFSGTVNRLQGQIESMGPPMSFHNVMMGDSQLNDHTNQQQITSYNGVLVWKISNFALKRQDATSGRQTSFFSPCFYTSFHGYKLCARIYLNGDGMGKGTHISLFFAVMRGEYDAILRWPFRQKVTFMLLDQDNVEHVIDAFRPDPNSSSFQRPRRETNIPSGCPTFCSLSELNNHAYVKDDAMFLKVIVDTTDL